MPATIALIAHDRKKDEMVNFVKQHQAVLARYQLIATGKTGERVKAQTNLAIELKLSGSMGGDAQIAALVAEGKVTAVIFLFDPLQAQPHEPDIQVLGRICAIYNIPLATNLATAEAIADALRRTRVAHLIFNPVSGQGNAEEELALIQQLLEPAMKLVVHSTTPEINPEELVKEAISAQADLIIASGGDGTVSAVAGELIGKDIPLGIIPRGTANAFAVAVGIPARLTPIRSSCAAILAGQTRIVDTALCNGLPMILLAGIGYEAEIVERADREAKNRWGALAYIMAGIQQFNEQELFETKIEIEGVIETFHAGAVTVANAAPSTSVMAQGPGKVIANDGMLDVTIAAPKSEIEAVTGMVELLGAALLKMPTNREDIVSLQTKHIKVTTNPPQKVVLDGELIGMTPIEVECIPKGLTIFAPPAPQSEDS
ncbi:MAG: methylglyoxal synthase [Symploca sp. SIO1A3]|nr:methylglyoxal synthase [Symploca sp. SIO1A3]